MSLLLLTQLIFAQQQFKVVTIVGQVFSGRHQIKPSDKLEDDEIIEVGANSGLELFDSYGNSYQILKEGKYRLSKLIKKYKSENNFFLGEIDRLYKKQKGVTIYENSPDIEIILPFANQFKINNCKDFSFLWRSTTNSKSYHILIKDLFDNMVLDTLVTGYKIKLSLIEDDNYILQIKSTSSETESQSYAIFFSDSACNYTSLDYLIAALNYEIIGNHMLAEEFYRRAIDITEDLFSNTYENLFNNFKMRYP